MNSDDFDLTEAASVYAVSNTPLFLVRKLQSDPIVHEIAESCSGEEIIEALRVAAATEPKSVNEAVRPYAYLVALWYKPELEHLLEAERIPAPNYLWFAYIASALVQTFSPVQKQLITVPYQIDSPKVFIGSSSETTILFLIS